MCPCAWPHEILVLISVEMDFLLQQHAFRMLAAVEVFECCLCMSTLVSIVAQIRTVGPFSHGSQHHPPPPKKKTHILNLRPVGPVGCRDVSKTYWKSASFSSREPSLEAMAVHLTRGASDIFASVIFDKKAKDQLVGVYIVPFLYFRQPLDLENVRHRLFEKLMPIARFRSRVVSVAGCLNLGHRSAFMELDDTTMKASFTELVTAPEGLRTDADLNHFVSNLYAQSWDPVLPLWRAFVLNGLEDGRSLLMLKIDHAMADGVGLLDVLYHIIDSKEDNSPKSPYVNQLKSTASAAPRSYWDGCLLHAKGWWRAIYRPFLGELMPGDPPNCFKFKNAKVAGKTKAVCSTNGIRLDEIKAIKSRISGATVNDVLMTLMSLTLRKYFMKYEASTLKQAVSATIPISVRKDAEVDIFNPKFFGNDFSMAQIHFPLKEEDPIKAFQKVKSQIDVIKVSPEPRVRSALVKSLTSCAAPQSVLASVLMDQFGRVTATLSNVIGPMQEVECLGQALDDLSFYAMVPLGLYLGVVQYNGWIKVGICCDGELEPSPERLADCWDEAFQTLKEASMQ